METFFVPVYLKFGKLSEEKMLVALIGVTPTYIWFNYSIKRVELSSKISGPSFAHLSKKVLEQIEYKAEELNKELGKSAKSLFDWTHSFNADYFQYLQKYSQNTLVFGQLESFDFDASSIGFKGLYESLMNEFIEEIKETKPNFQSKIKHKLESANIQEKVDLDFKITPDQLNGIYNNTIVTLIAKNGGILAANTIDFNNGVQSIAQSLNAFEVLLISLNNFASKHNYEKSKYSIVTSLPAFGSEQEKLYNNIYKYKKDVFKIIPEDSIEELTTQIQKNNYKKFSSVFMN